MHRTLAQSPAPMWWLTTTYNSRSRGLNTHFRHPWEPGRHPCRTSHIRAGKTPLHIKENKHLKKKRVMGKKPLARQGVEWKVWNRSRHRNTGGREGSQVLGSWALCCWEPFPFVNEWPHCHPQPWAPGPPRCLGWGRLRSEVHPKTLLLCSKHRP